MPSYDYRCRTCDTTFEVRRALADATAVTCPAGHPQTSRVFTPVAVSGMAQPVGAGRGGGGGCCGGGCCG